jgi:hypothetical protein
MQHDDSLNWFLFHLYISISVPIHAATPAITRPQLWPRPHVERWMTSWLTSIRTVPGKEEWLASAGSLSPYDLLSATYSRLQTRWYLSFPHGRSKEFILKEVDVLWSWPVRPSDRLGRDDLNGGTFFTMKIISCCSFLRIATIYYPQSNLLHDIANRTLKNYLSERFSSQWQDIFNVVTEFWGSWPVYHY